VEYYVQFISPEELKMPDEFKLYLDNLGLKYYEHNDFTDIISKADIIYMTRVQKERFSDPIEYEKVKNVYVLRNSMLKNTKPNMRILHPLPRVMRYIRMWIIIQKLIILNRL